MLNDTLYLLIVIGMAVFIFYLINHKKKYCPKCEHCNIKKYKKKKHKKQKKEKKHKKHKKNMKHEKEEEISDENISLNMLSEKNDSESESENQTEISSLI